MPVSGCFTPAFDLFFSLIAASVLMQIFAAMSGPQDMCSQLAALEAERNAAVAEALKVDTDVFNPISAININL